MDEQEWKTCTDVRAMLAHLRAGGLHSERKLRLLACGCCRTMDRCGNVSGLTVVDLAEQVADGFLPLAEARRREEQVCRLFADDWAAAAGPLELAERLARDLRAWRKAPRTWLLRCLFGNPFRPWSSHPGWLAWNNAIVVRLAKAAYDERRMPAGTLDPVRLAVLADALEEAGCDDAPILAHLRSPGPHVRGCHVLDLILSKDRSSKIL